MFLPELQEHDGMRYYQRQCHDAIYRSWREGNQRVLAVLATGLGKTQIFCHVANNWDGSIAGDQPWQKRVLVLCHRDELVQQAHNRMVQITGDGWVGLEQAGWKSSGERIVIGSVQSVFQPKRLDRLAAQGGFGLTIVDECHHYISPAFRRPLERFHGAYALGVTATPDRSDEKALGQLFDDVPFSMDIEDGITSGYLAPIVGHDIRVTDIDISRVKAARGDLAIGELDSAMQKACEGICAGLLEHHPDRRGPIFWPGKMSARLACEILNRYNPGSACVVTEETDRDERREIMRGIRSGAFQWFCNCQIATEGFDWPEANLVGLARPTKSRSLFCQMIGRGTRVLPGLVDDIPGEEGAEDRRGVVQRSDKPNCMIANFVGNGGKHELITTVDALAGNYSQAVTKRARKLSEANPGGNALEMLRQAERELKELARAHEARVKTVAEEYDPFLVLGIKKNGQKYQRYGSKPITEKQYLALTKAGFTEQELSGCDKRAASALMGEVIRRRNEGLCSLKQLRQLQRFGVTSTKVSFESAKAAMNYLQHKGWGKKDSIDASALKRLVGQGE